MVCTALLHALLAPLWAEEPLLRLSPWCQSSGYEFRLRGGGKGSQPICFGLFAGLLLSDGKLHGSLSQTSSSVLRGRSNFT